MSTMRISAAAAAALAAGVVVAGCGGDDKDKTKTSTTTVGRTTTVAVPSPDQKLKRDHLTVYLSMAFQGLSKPTAVSVRNSAQLALEQAGGRAGGMRVELVALDDASATTGTSDKDAILQNARTAVTDPTTIAYIGDEGSGDTALSLPIINSAGILQVSATNTAPGLTLTGSPDPGAPGKYYPRGVRTYGRIVPTDRVQGRAISELAKQLRCNQVGVIDDGGLFGRGLAAEVRASGPDDGLSFSRRVTVDLAKTDGSAAVSAIAAGAPDCVVYAGSANTKIVSLWGRLHARLPDARLIGPDALANAEFALRIGTAGPKTYLTTATVASKYFNEAGQDYLSTYSTRFGGTPDPSGVYGYESMKAILASINAAGNEPTRSQVTAQWFAIKNRPSALGTYSITNTGDSTLTTFGAYNVRDEALQFFRVLNASAKTSG